MPISRIVLALTLLFLLPQAQACKVYLSIGDNAQQHELAELGPFVRTQFRPLLRNVPNSERVKLTLKRQCEDKLLESSAATTLTVQRNNYYILELNGIALQCTGGASACGNTQYDYVRYAKGDMLITQRTIEDQILIASSFTSPAQFKTGPESENARHLHNVIKVFAFVFAEAARFDEILASLDVMTPTCGVEFMSYWPLTHNWATISRTVADAGSTFPLPSPTLHGAYGLLAPITPAMRTYFNEDLVRNPTMHKPEGQSAKNRTVPDVTQLCQPTNR